MMRKVAVWWGVAMHLWLMTRGALGLTRERAKSTVTCWSEMDSSRSIGVLARVLHCCRSYEDKTASNGANRMSFSLRLVSFTMAFIELPSSG